MSSSETSQSVRTEGDIQDKFIRVYDPVDLDKVEILLAKDGTMPLSYLERRFPGAICLEYKNPKTECKRAVMFDEEKKAFLAPSDGWGDKLFTIIYKDRRQPRGRMVCY